MTNVKILLACVLALGTSVTAAKANDGKVDLKDFPLFLNPLTQLPAAITAGPAALEEYKNATPEQRDELTQWVRSEFNIENDKVEQKIEAAIQIAITAGQLVA
ncbi:hypothetical protein Bb109J_c1944 [Bdellovibrio bacteriovorus]|uniref:hypothetical protein n=1 Tax=Bdellovibrio bacteriovorus TaxID=959 RepID=UPI00045C0EC9|nr:hypothetical protein [Bdellovibrio bacteriovorus]AHZ84634.1 hypothetical protein EP01_06745 [Bdellovibrio bacteriovorus]BEV68524.1 hypothetical protein Bb109J_c1944 [Bdellovibrio bacteriovorus]